MHKIYFDLRCLEICGDGGMTHEDVVLSVEKFKNSPQSILTLQGGEPVYDIVRTLFKEVDAAGGLVRNEAGDFLFIRRSGLWDLPKGHREDGEDMQTTALREVREETGAEDLEMDGYLCTTEHCYFRNGIWHLKHTFWYAMHTLSTIPPVPQTEEGISEALWVNSRDIGKNLEKTYPSILEVFECMKLYEANQRIV